MKIEDIVKAFDILNKFKFFGGQRAGRELWFDKPVDIQNEDIKNFVDDVNFLESFIDSQKAEIEKLQKENCELKDGYFQKRYEETEHQELMGLRMAWRKSTDQNMDLQLEIEGLQKDLGIWKDIATRETSYVSIAKAEAIKEFAEKLKAEITTGDGVLRVSTIDIIDDLVKEMTEVSDET